jgi:holin-like protein
MLAYITMIFAFQLAGELLVAAIRLPIPGPVAGMLMLFCGLLMRGSVPAQLAQVGDFLLGNFSLLFVPAGVGVMLHAGVLAREWLPIFVALIASTLLTIAMTAVVMRDMTRRLSQRSDRP